MTLKSFVLLPSPAPAHVAIGEMAVMAVIEDTLPIASEAVTVAVFGVSGPAPYLGSRRAASVGCSKHPYSSAKASKASRARAT